MVDVMLLMMLCLWQSFNQDIGNWDVSSVTDMECMFYHANSFNQDLSGWCVTNIASETILVLVRIHHYLKVINLFGVLVQILLLIIISVMTMVTAL